MVKIVSTEYLAEFGDDKQEVETEIERFHREALTMAQVRHPYVAQVDHEMRPRYQRMEKKPQSDMS